MKTCPKNIVEDKFSKLYSEFEENVFEKCLSQQIYCKDIIYLFAIVFELLYVFFALFIIRKHLYLQVVGYMFSLMTNCYSDNKYLCFDEKKCLSKQH